jgi:hypothetical protein
MVGVIVQVRIANLEFGTVFDYSLKREWRAGDLSPRSTVRLPSSAFITQNLYWPHAAFVGRLA